MVHPLPVTDFRAVRCVLDADDYAIGGEEVSATDLIEPAIWHGLMDLPDDIAVTISSHHGKELELLYNLHSDWVQSIGDQPDFDELYDGMLTAADCFQSATFSFLHGYYRSAMSDLRAALEAVAIGCYGNYNPDDQVFTGWKEGRSDLTFPNCLGHLRKRVRQTPVAWFLKQGAWPLTLYYDLSRYTHSRPDGSDGALWESNGPVYKGFAIQLTFEMHLCVFAINYLLTKIARPNFQLPDTSRIVFELEWLPGHTDVQRAFGNLFGLDR